MGYWFMLVIPAEAEAEASQIPGLSGYTSGSTQAWAT